MKREVFFILALLLILIPITSASFGYNNPNLPHLEKIEEYINKKGDDVTGTYNFNGGWMNNGLSIIGGNIFAQVGYFYNITSLNVTKQNLTILEDAYFNGKVGIGTTFPDTGLHVGTGTTSHSLSSTNDTFISGRLEVDGFSFFDGGLNRFIGAGGDNLIQFHTGSVTVGALGYFANDGLHFSARTGAGRTNNIILMTDLLNFAKDHDHTEQINPTFIVHSVTNPDDDNTEWLSMSYINETDYARIETGKGDINLVPASGQVNISGNLTLGQKITFALGEIIDNIVDGWITITGNLNITGNTTIEGDLNVTGLINNDAIYCESSDLNDQTFAVAGVRYRINITNVDEGNGITMSTGNNGTNITIETSGVYHLVAQPQVKAGAGSAGDFHMWIEKDSGSGFVDVSDSNIELKLSSLEEDVIVLATTSKLNQGDVLRLVASVSNDGILLHAQSPAGEPVIPSIIFTMYRVGS